MIFERKTRKRCHMYQMLARAAKKRHVSFHTPGHKRGKWDITELSFSDNLSAPRGVIAAAQKDIAAILGAAASFILTDGSTSGVFCMLHAARAVGVKRVAFSPLVHKSVYNACAVLNLTPLFLPQSYSNGFPTRTTAETLVNDPNFHACDAVLLTSPDYYGTVADLESIRAVCEKAGKYLLIDGAHGGHLHYDRPLYAGSFADLWVDGVHKSLPAYTQGAVVSARTAELGERLRAAADIFRTTSPAYPIMASVEYAVKYPRNERLEACVTAFTKSTLGVYVNDDWTKLCVRFQDAVAVQTALERHGIYAEYRDGEILCFYLSPATRAWEWRLLKKWIRRFPRKEFDGEDTVRHVPAPAVLENRATEWVEIHASEGRIAAANCGVFPPCTPSVFVGERVRAEAVRTLTCADNVFGVADGKILVYKE